MFDYESQVNNIDHIITQLYFHNLKAKTESTDWRRIVAERMLLRKFFTVKDCY